jgi:hypothetical protein
MKTFFSDNLDHVVHSACAFLRQGVIASIPRSDIKMTAKDAYEKIKQMYPKSSGGSLFDWRFASKRKTTHRSFARIHLVVNFVLQSLGTMVQFDGNNTDSTAFQSDKPGYIAPITLLRDMVMDSVDSIDVTVIRNNMEDSTRQAQVCVSILKIR